MKKQPLFDVSRFNRIADKHNIPWIDRIPLIETVCWGSKGWIDADLSRKLRGRWNGYRRNGQYGAFMGEVMSALSAHLRTPLPSSRLATYRSATCRYRGLTERRHIPV